MIETLNVIDQINFILEEQLGDDEKLHLLHNLAWDLVNVTRKDEVNT